MDSSEMTNGINSNDGVAVVNVALEVVAIVLVVVVVFSCCCDCCC